MLEDLANNISTLQKHLKKAINKLLETSYLLCKEDYKEAFKCCGEDIEIYTEMLSIYRDALNEQKNNDIVDDIVTKDAGDLEILRQVVRQQDEEIEFLKRIISKLA